MTSQTSINQLKLDYQLDKREIDLVICHVLKINTAALIIHEGQLSPNQDTKIREMLSKRQQGVPFAYLTGFKGFWNLTLKVNKHTLIPRPETELIIDYVLSKTPTNFTGTILDLGTGTGAIALSLAQELPQATVVAVDQSLKCVEIANDNQNIHHLNNVEILQSNWFDNLANRTFDLIISNPPYIAAGDKHLQNLLFEPHSALVAANKGYSDLEHIILHAKKHMTSNAELILEHGYNQSTKIQQKLKANCYRNVKSHKDLAGIERITTADVPKSCY